MLKQWGLGNFKSFYEETKLDLAPLTILTGGNSSGKSSIIQSILLIAQTLANPIKERELVLNGPLVELGFLKDNLSDPGKDMKISFKYLHSNYGVEMTIECSLIFDSREKIQKYSCLKDLKWTLVGSEEKGSVTIQKTKNGEMLMENYEGCFKPDLGIYGDPRKANGIKVTLDHFLPDYYFFAPDHPKMIEIHKKASMNFIEDIKNRIPTNFDNFNNDLEKNLWINIKNLIEKKNNTLFKNIMEINHYVNSINRINYDNWRKGLYELISSYDDLIFLYKSEEEKILEASPSQDIVFANHYIKEEIFSCIKYIGPLRFRSVVYPYSKAGDPKDVGISGEYVASVIHAFAEKEVAYNPPQYIANYTEFFFHLKELPLKKALENWLEYLEIAKEIKVEQTEKTGFLLKIKPLKHTMHNSDEFLDLTQVGTGISQVLPILVMGLLDDKNSMLLFEQPELHLHPSLQARLADFFISLALLGKQCIIESHSEYFVDIFRARISKSLLNNSEHIKNITKIYFFDKGDSGTKVIPIEINEYAGYTNWPSGFFDERQKIDEEILDNLNKKNTYDDDDLELLDD